MNVNGTEYYYLKNAQGDVTHIVDADGIEVASYEYDAWGNHLSISGDATIAELNPYRYRGYRYDSETGLYYLQSRYYNPEWGRFINADELVSTGQGLHSHNMFAYCNNNPIMFVDIAGKLPFLIITAVAGAVIGAVIGGVVAAQKGGNVWAGIGIGATAGGLIGLTGGAAVSMLATAGSTAGITALAGTKTVLTGLGIMKASAGTVVIGETMERVTGHASQINAEVYQGFYYYNQVASKMGTVTANFLGKIDNALWITNKMLQNTKIVDIGIDPGRVYRSSSYFMERALTFFYQNKETLFLK
jgi:RHS repeat-associated protein